MPKDELYHHGILGQRWGRRRFQKKDGTRTAAGRKRDRATDKKRNKLKTAAAIAGVAVVAGLAAYGGYKLGKMNKGAIIAGKTTVDSIIRSSNKTLSNLKPYSKESANGNKAVNKTIRKLRNMNNASLRMQQDIFALKTENTRNKLHMKRLNSMMDDLNKALEEGNHEKEAQLVRQFNKIGGTDSFDEFTKHMLNKNETLVFGPNGKTYWRNDAK